MHYPLPNLTTLIVAYLSIHGAALVSKPRPTDDFGLRPLVDSTTDTVETAHVYRRQPQAATVPVAAPAKAAPKAAAPKAAAPKKVATPAAGPPKAAPTKAAPPTAGSPAATPTKAGPLDSGLPRAAPPTASLPISALPGSALPSSALPSSALPSSAPPVDSQPDTTPTNDADFGFAPLIDPTTDDIERPAIVPRYRLTLSNETANVVPVAAASSNTTTSPSPDSSAQVPGTFTPPGDFNGQVAWTGWESKDGQKNGSDVDNVLYVRPIIDLLLSRLGPEKRTGIFWSGGNKAKSDFANIKRFITDNLKGNGMMYYDWWTLKDIEAMGLDSAAKDGPYWRMCNRVSKALAAGSTNDKAYIYMQPVNGRTIFSPASQLPMDNDPEHGGQATNGEVWVYAELPALMRNTNIKQIIMFYEGANGNLEQQVEWDVDVDLDKPRNFMEDVPLDLAPVIMPAAIGRPPLKM